MICPITTNQYIDTLVSTNRKIDLMVFVSEIHRKFFTDEDISFMDDFMKWSDEEVSNQFIVHWSNLQKYGVTNNENSTHFKERLLNLDLIEDTDFIVKTSKITRSNGSKAVKKDYYLTPRAFKLALMRAKRVPGQKVDVFKYADYYIFLEKCIRYFDKYEKKYAVALAEKEREEAKKEREEAKKRESELNKRLAIYESKMNTIIDTNIDLKNEIKESEAKHEARHDKLIDKIDDLKEDINDIHDAIVDTHQVNLTETANHSTGSTDPDKMCYFAMTACQRVGDDSGTLYFQTTRTQSRRMTRTLVDLMTTEKVDRDIGHCTKHSLIIPPIYSPGAVQSGNCGLNNLNDLGKSILDKFNEGRPKKNKIRSSKKLFEFLNIKAGSRKMTWTPNKYISCEDVIDCYLNAVIGPKMTKLSVAEADLQKRIDAAVLAQKDSILHSSELARIQIEDLVKRTNEAIATAELNATEQAGNAQDADGAEEVDYESDF